jgi:hypothetical protein
MRFLCGARAASSSSSSWVVRNQLLRLSPVEPPRCAPRPTLPHRDFQQLLVQIRPLVHPPASLVPSTSTPPPLYSHSRISIRPSSTSIDRRHGEDERSVVGGDRCGGVGEMVAATRGRGGETGWRCGREMGWRCGGDGGGNTVGDGDYNWYFSFSPSELLLPPPVPSSSGVAAPA